MSFGFCINGLLTVIELVHRVRKGFVDAPHQFGHISTELRSLSIVLQDADVALSTHEGHEHQVSNIQEIVRGCHDVLADLEKLLSEYGELDTTQSGSSNFKRRLARLKWQSEDIQGLRNRLTSNTALLSASVGQLSRSQTICAVKRGLDCLNLRQDNDERLIILDWLTPFDYGAQQSDTISRRQNGTGQWFLDSPEFRALQKAELKTLFCPGIPGAGKTTLTSIVVDKLTEHFNNDDTVFVAYIYCNYRPKFSQGIADLLASLLKQMAQHNYPLPESVKLLYDKHINKRTRPSLDEISKTLTLVATTFSKGFIIVDALDECETSDGCRSRLLSEIFGLQKKCGLHFFATSRFIPDIMAAFHGRASLEIRAAHEDVQKYVEERLKEPPLVLKHRADLRDDLVLGIVTTVDGMFLLAKLHLDFLISKPSPKKMKAALAQLRSGSEAYDDAYRRAMERIEGQTPDQKELAKQMLAWLTCANRPLVTTELLHALAVEPSEQQFDPENLSELEDIVSMCAGLVTVDEESNIIRLVHYTTQDFFERTQQQWFPHAEAEITRNCITYLSFAAFDSSLHQSTSRAENVLKSHPFYDYAAHNWGYHTRQAFFNYKKDANISQCCILTDASEQTTSIKRWQESSLKELLELAIEFLNKNNPTRETWRKVIERADSREHIGLTENDLPGALYYSVKLQLMDVAVVLIEEEATDVNEAGSLGSALSIASWNGTKDLAALLLENGADAILPDRYGRTPIHLASENGHVEVVKLLLEHKSALEPTASDPKHKIAADNGANICDGTMRSPLHYSALHSQTRCAELLLDQGAEITVDIENMTALHYAVLTSSEELAQCLLDASVSINTGVTRHIWRSKYEGQMLQYVLHTDSSRDVKKGINDCQGLTGLHYAALTGCQRMTKFLLDRAANPNIVSANGETPLHLALKRDLYGPKWSQVTDHWNDPIHRIESALDFMGYESEDEDERAKTEVLIEEHRLAVLTLLLGQNLTDVNAKDEYGNSPLHSVIYENSNAHEIIRLLIERGANVCARNAKGQTPIHLACVKGSLQSVSTLVKHGAQVTDCDSDGLNAIHFSAQNRDKNILLHLVTMYPRAAVAERDKSGRNALHHLVGDAEHVDEGLVRALLQGGVNVNDLDDAGLSPLALYMKDFLVLSRSVPRVIETFFQYGSDPLFETREGHLGLAHLHAQSYKVRVEVLKVFMDFDIDLAAKDDQDRTILHHCAISGSLTPESSNFLRSRVGLDTELPDANGKTPRQYAAEMRRKTHHPHIFDPDRWARTEKLLCRAISNEEL